MSAFFSFRQLLRSEPVARMSVSRQRYALLRSRVFCSGNLLYAFRFFSFRSRFGAIVYFKRLSLCSVGYRLGSYFNIFTARNLGRFTSAGRNALIHVRDAVSAHLLFQRCWLPTRGIGCFRFLSVLSPASVSLSASAVCGASPSTASAPWKSRRLLRSAVHDGRRGVPGDVCGAAHRFHRHLHRKSGRPVRSYLRLPSSIVGI